MFGAFTQGILGQRKHKRVLHVKAFDKGHFTVKNVHKLWRRFNSRHLMMITYAMQDNLLGCIASYNRYK